MIATPRRRTRRLRLPRPSPRALLALPVIALVLAGGWLWLRDSSLVAIRRVQVIGLSGPSVGQIRGALTAAAKRMTTLDIEMGSLDAAVAAYPQVISLRVSTELPHRAVIYVNEQVPVATVQIGGQSEFVDSDGVLLAHPPIPTGSLPTLALSEPPAGSRLTSPDSLALVAALAAAPYQLLSRISDATSTAAHGVTIQLRNGPQLYFGSSGELSSKWKAAIGVLGDSTSAGASYIDVTDPRRPAAGA